MAAKGSWIRVNAVDAHLNATTVNSIIKTNLSGRAVSITQKPAVRQAVGEAYLEVVTPFVPSKTGDLRESGRATDDGRVYWTAIRPPYNVEGSYAFNYAEATFDPKFRKWGKGKTYDNPSTVGTTPRWTENVRPDTDEWEVFTAKVADIVKEAFKDD